MTVQIKNKYLFLALCGAFLAIFLLGGYMGLRKRDRASERVQVALNEEIRQYKYQLDSVAKVAYEKDRVIATLREAIKRGDVEKAELKELAYSKIKEVTKLTLVIDSLLHIEPSDSIIIDTVYIDNKPTPAIALPYVFKENNKFFTLKGTFDKKGALDLSLRMEARLDVWSGIKDGKPTVTITSDNPFLNVEDIKSITFDKQKPKKWGIGITAGYGITKENLSPFVGIGLTRTIIRF
jgi:hypothetical protein